MDARERNTDASIAVPVIGRLATTIDLGSEHYRWWWFLWHTIAGGGSYGTPIPVGRILVLRVVLPAEIKPTERWAKLLGKPARKTPPGGRVMVVVQYTSFLVPIP